MKSDFSASVYFQFLNDGLKRGCRFFALRDFAQASSLQGHTVLLRHDVDICLETALRMAQLENKAGVNSTYFVLLRSPFYNALSPRGGEILREICSLGHEIGLHWDGRLIPSEPEAARRTLRGEAELLSGVCGQEIVSAAQHFPTVSGRLDLSRDFKVDTYSPAFMEKFIYVSDSSMSWRGRDLSDVARQPGHYQLLLHPVWWMYEGKNQEEKLAGLLAVHESATRVEIDAFHALVMDGLAKREELDQKFKSSMKSK